MISAYDSTPAAARSAGLVPSINNAEMQVLRQRKQVAQLQQQERRNFNPAPITETSEGFTVDKEESRRTRFRKNLGVGCKLLSKGAGQAWMLTFTYRDDVEWGASHIRTALDHLRKAIRRTHAFTLRYVWVMESKQRKSGTRLGEVRPHYHCIVWVPMQVCIEDLKFDALGYWPHGMTNAVKAVAPVKYIMEYAKKYDAEHGFPKGAKCYGMGGLDSLDRSIRRWINWPSFVQARAAVGDLFARAKGGGWTDRASGEWWPSEFGLVNITRASVRVVRLFTHERLLSDVRGPYSWNPHVAH